MNDETKEFLLHEYDAGRQHLVALEERRYTSFRFLLILVATMMAAGGTVLIQASHYLWVYGACALAAAYVCRLISKMLQNEERSITRYRNLLNQIRKYFYANDQSVAELKDNPNIYGTKTDRYELRIPSGTGDFLAFFFRGSSHTFSTIRVILICSNSITWVFISVGVASIVTSVVLCCR